MNFRDCVLFCFDNKDLVREFDRLTHSNLSGKGSPVELAIDRAAGRFETDAALFIHFVYEVIWTRLPQECFE